MLVGEFLHNSAVRLPEKPALVAGDVRMTFAEADSLANRIANAMLAQGLGKGSNVAVLSTNTPQYAVLHFAAARAGAVLTHLSFRMTAPEMSALARKVGVRALFFDPLLTELARSVLSVTPEIAIAVSLAEAPGDKGDKGDTGWVGLERFVASADAGPPSVSLRDDSPVGIIFTGGTTGLPKAVLVSHKARVASTVAAMVEFGIDERDVVGCAAPLFHNAGLYCWFQMAVGLGCTSVLMPTWNPATVPLICRNERISALFAVPTQLNGLLLAKDFDPSMLASVQKINFAGARMPPQQFERLMATFPQADLIEHYGQSEFGIISVRRHWRHVDKASSVGRAAFNVEIAVFDRNSNMLPAGETGEVAVRGDGVMNGYVGDEEETARYLRFDGWLYTGDIGWLDAEGYLTLVDRSKDIIIMGGENIASAEIEIALYAHEAVAECAVFAIPEEHWGEVPAAHVVLKSGASVTEQELQSFCSGRIASHKRPRIIKFVDALPKTPVGKVQKAVIRRDYWGALKR
jgi:acyl-CoA synthetase (AMP-forming)/AMP-acid ligase II